MDKTEDEKLKSPSVETEIMKTNDTKTLADFEEEEYGEETDKFKLLTTRFDVFFVTAILVIFVAGVLALWIIAATDKTVTNTEEAAQETIITN